MPKAKLEEKGPGESIERPNRMKEIRSAFIAEERAAILTALEKHDWIQTYAAHELGTSLGSLSSAMRRHPELRKEASLRANKGRPRKNPK